MKVEIIAYSHLCCLRTFTINGIDAREEEFVNKYDHRPDEAEDYACGDMRADSILVSEDVLLKYGITEQEAELISDKVAAEVSFGCCGLCQ